MNTTEKNQGTQDIQDIMQEPLTEEEKELNKKKKSNIKLYKIYRIFSWDLLCYFTTIYLFLANVKGMDASEILLFEAFYVLFKFVVQIPCTLVIQRLGKRNSLVVANFLAAAHIIVIMIAPNFGVLMISQIMCAVAYITKSTCESDMLYDSIERGPKRGHKFAEIDSKAVSKYYYIEAIASILSGFLFVVNPYIPLTICFIILFMTFVMSIGFEEIHSEQIRKQSIVTELKELRRTFKNIFKSHRLKSLLLFNGIFVALLRTLQMVRNTVLVAIGMPEQYFGIIFAVMGIESGTSARFQNIIHKKFGNRTLTAFALPLAISCLFMGLILLANFNPVITIPLILIIFALQYKIKGPYYIFIRQYFNNFTTSEKRVKIATTNNLCENFIASILVFIASGIMKIASVEFTTIIIGCCFLLGFIFLLEHMKKTVGLKMEEYDKKELL